MKERYLTSARSKASARITASILKEQRRKGDIYKSEREKKRSRRRRDRYTITHTHLLAIQRLYGFLVYPVKRETQHTRANGKSFLTAREQVFVVLAAAAAACIYIPHNKPRKERERTSEKAKENEKPKKKKRRFAGPKTLDRMR